jgi:hypothetical protein
MNSLNKRLNASMRFRCAVFDRLDTREPDTQNR